MRQHRITKSIDHKRIQFTIIIRPIHCPVFPQPLRTQHQNSIVPKLKILNHRKRFIGLPKSHTIGNNATIMGQYFINSSPCAIPLKLKQRSPNFRINQLILVTQQSTTILICQKLLKNMKQRFKINKLRRMISIKLI